LYVVKKEKETVEALSKRAIKLTNAINRCLFIVKNSGKNLDSFEKQGDSVQADYHGTGRDTNLLDKVSQYGITSQELTNYLNAERKLQHPNE
jgi:hypothetical protein